MSDLSRREAVQLLASVSSALGLTPQLLERAWRHARSAPAVTDRERLFFTETEWRTVTVLVDDIIPRDQRSGSATDAGVPDFMDFILNEGGGLQTRIRGGLAWLDGESRARYGKPYAEAAERQRHGLLDDIAWPGRARPEHSHGVAFFNTFRDFTASGFFSSQMGMEDLQYLGNTVVAEWNGCPPQALQKLGVRYE